MITTFRGISRLWFLGFALLGLGSVGCISDDSDPNEDEDAGGGSGGANGGSSGSAGTTGGTGATTGGTGTGGSSGGAVTVCSSPIVLPSSKPSIATFDEYDGATSLATWSFSLGGDSSSGVLAGTFGYGDHTDGASGQPEVFAMVDGNDSMYALSISDTDGANRRHNVRQDKMLFFSGAPTAGAINFSISASAGSYHYYCELHGTPNPGSIGMQGTVKVKPIANANPAGAPFTATWALPGTNTGTRFDVRFRRGTTGPFTAWRNDTATRTGIFGQAGAPVTVAPGQTYQIQARSQKAPSQQSDWSPVLTFST